MPTHAALIRDGAQTLAAAGVDGPERDARLLMRWVLGTSGAGLSAVLSDEATGSAAARFTDAIATRAARHPLSHITGRRAFWTLEFEVTPDVLDPRPETEVLVADAIHRGPFQRVLDLGTGSGCILLSLLDAWPDATGIGTDASTAALTVAERNAAATGVGSRAAMLHADWYDGIDGTFDLIVSNPPYIAEDEIAALSPEVRLHEPMTALSPGGDGFDAYRAIADGALAHLSADGFLMVEIGPTQSHGVAAIMASAGLSVIAVIPDIDQRPRVIVSRQ